jgi:hypothetical protein
VRSWSIIAAFFAVTFLLATQCRAQCLVLPGLALPQETKHSLPECPLHKSKVPAEQEQDSKCNHAPQWDADQVRSLEFDLPAPAPELIETAFYWEAPAFTPRGIERPRVPLVLRI